MRSSEMSDLERQIEYLEQFVIFAEKMMKGTSSLEQTFEMQAVIFDTQIQLGMLVLERVRMIKSKKLEEMQLVPNLMEELKVLEMEIRELEQEVEEWLMRRTDNEDIQEMQSELQDMLDQLQILCDVRDGLSLKLEFSGTDILFSFK